MFHYERLSGEIESKISDGTYQIGEKLPSVRKLGRSLNLSITTVLKAYHNLEDQGIIQARAKSGFIVQLPDLDFSTEIFQEKLLAPKEIPFSSLMQDLLAENKNQNILRLSLAQPEPEVLPLDALSKIIRKVLRTPNLRISDYLDPKGLLAFRAKIAALMLERGVNVSASEILVTNGCQQALRISLECVLKKGDIIAVESPCYPGLLHIACELGARVLEIPARAGTGLDLNLLAEALETHDIRAIFLTPTCSNPGGGTIPVDHRRAIVELANHYKSFIIEDETNCDLFYRNSPPPSLKSFDKNENIINCGSFSKTLGPGLRLGWMLPGKFMKKALAKRYIDDLGGPAIEQYVLAEFVGTGSYYKALARAKNIHARTTTLMVRKINEEFPKGTEVKIPTGGFLLWLKLPGNLAGEDFRKAALGKGISIAPGALFSEIKEKVNFIRLGWGGKWNEEIEKAISILGKIAKEKVLG